MGLPNDYVRRFVPAHKNSSEIELELLTYYDTHILELYQYDMFIEGAKPHIVVLKGPQIEQLYQTLGNLLKELQHAAKEKTVEED